MTTQRNDLQLYDRHAAEWWDERGRFAASRHGVNALRLRHLDAVYGSDMHGIDVVDLGCGGGLIAEPLARRGANVIGIDASSKSLDAARVHAAGLSGLRYQHGDIRAPDLPARCANLVVCADVLEHVDGWPAVVAAAARLLRPGGRLYVTTQNRTWLARILVVHVAETLRVVPPGTHDYNRFIRPDELIAAASAHGLGSPRILGQRLRLLATIRAWAARLDEGRSTAIGYAAWFTATDATS
ncbi:MAG: bifunctional 2-polyprenyl-6-hydroxyphenol methylase/3-demethylubiquinol 3-O-methyltransferase UbiG [Planctomycetota bacterium]